MAWIRGVGRPDGSHKRAQPRRVLDPGGALDAAADIDAPWLEAGHRRAHVLGVQAAGHDHRVTLRKRVGERLVPGPAGTAYRIRHKGVEQWMVSGLESS